MRALLLFLLILSSVVILLGALAKIQHWPVANPLLGAGLMMEIACAIGLVVLSWRARKQ